MAQLCHLSENYRSIVVRSPLQRSMVAIAIRKRPLRQ
jgi:hypothetical protein